jgi:hypothetical protein
METHLLQPQPGALCTSSLNRSLSSFRRLTFDNSSSTILLRQSVVASPSSGFRLQTVTDPSFRIWPLPAAIPYRRQPLLPLVGVLDCGLM